MTLVVLNDRGALKLIQPALEGSARREQAMRDLIYDHPEILPIHALDPSYSPVFTVARELSIPGVGFVDVLLADERGRLVVVECKLWRNPQARREVVGQILDYARELSRYAYEDLQRQVSIASKRQGNVLFELAREAGSELDEARFVDRVTRDLSAGRFLLLIVGDGIAEGTRRIGEYLRDQPGLAFEFGLIEMAEYQFTDEGGASRTIVQPRVLAQTTLIERHVIRSEVPGVVLDAVAEPSVPSRADRPVSDYGAAWRAFVDKLAQEMQFDDPAQARPRIGGNGWIRLPLPGGLYINLYRSKKSGNRIGGHVRFAGAEAEAIFADLLADRSAIDQEFAAAGLEAPEWQPDGEPGLLLTTPSPQPWDEQREVEQRAWFANVGNQFVNSLRPRLLRIAGPAR